jgi:acetylornithine deacetylase/succinyl-diaminopimelate desuccinylase-like protein
VLKLGFTAAMVALASIAAAKADQNIAWQSVQQEAISILQRYVRIDSSNPPGNTTETADFLSKLIEAEGLKVVRYESAAGKIFISTRLKGTTGERPILLLHHMDVVPAEPENWTHGPFGGDLVDGVLWGRGTIDMKGIGVSHLLALFLLKRQSAPLNRDVVFLAVPDEEVGGDLGTRWLIEHHFSDLNPEYVLDEGGFGSRDQFADNKLVFGIAVAEKKAIWIKVTAEGIAGHGSQPDQHNPNDRLVRALNKLLSAPWPAGSTEIVRIFEEKVGSLADNKFTNAIRRPTVALTSLRSGVGDPPKVNVIPARAEATLDCRILPGMTKQELLDQIRDRLDDSGLKIEVILETEDPIVTPWDTPLYRALESSLLRQYPEAIVAPMMVPYGTDSNAFRQKGVKSYGINPMVLPAEIVAAMHGDNERVPASELGKAVRVFYEALREAAQQ